MIRFALVALAIIAGWSAQTSSADADPVADIGALITQCETEQQDAKCAAQFWNFADLTGDSRLTVAEITRFFRLLVEHQANQANSAAPTPGAVGSAVDPFEAVAVAFLVGPVAAGLVVDNFDYNGNRTIEREEVFADIDEGAFTKYVFDESKKLPERAGTLMLRALQAGSAVREQK